jgi:hypothetical protein
MLEILLVILVLLFLTGNLNLAGIRIPNLSLFVLNGHPITLINLLIFLIVLWAVGLLPSPFREIAGVLLVLWILSILGILAFAGLSNLLIIAIIVGIVASFIKR